MAGRPETVLFRLLDVFRHLLQRRALHRPTVQFLQHSPRSHAPAMGNLLRFVVDYRACLAPSVPFALLGRCPPVGHAYPHLLAVRLCLQVARPIRIPEIHPGIRFYLCGRLPRFRHLLSDGNGQTARHSLLHPPHSGLPSRLRSFFQSEKTLGVVHPTGLQPSARRMESHGIHPHLGSRSRGHERMAAPLRAPYRQDAARTGRACKPPLPAPT